MNVPVSPEAAWWERFDMRVIVGLSFGEHGREGGISRYLSSNPTKGSTTHVLTNFVLVGRKRANL